MVTAWRSWMIVPVDLLFVMRASSFRLVFASHRRHPHFSTFVLYLRLYSSPRICYCIIVHLARIVLYIDYRLLWFAGFYDVLLFQDSIIFTVQYIHTDVHVFLWWILHVQDNQSWFPGKSGFCLGFRVSIAVDLQYKWCTRDKSMYDWYHDSWWLPCQRQ